MPDRAQVRIACDAGRSTPELVSLTDRLIEKLPKLLGGDVGPSLLHGDLWNGNFLVGSRGGAVLIDPAVYYGHREAELALPMLFGGFSDTFFDAYREAWPLDDGWEERLDVYKLYHLLNHHNMFGGSYLADCIDLLGRIV